MPTLSDYAWANHDNDLLETPKEISPGTLDMDLIQDMVAALKVDRVKFEKYDNYLDGKHLKPFAPRKTTAQIRDIQKRSVTNLIPLLVNLPSQVLFCDGYRRGEDAAEDVDKFPPEYREWQKNQMDARQSILYRAAFKYGHSFLHVNNVDGPDNIRLEVLPTRHTVAFWEDPVNDRRPAIVLTHKTRPRKDGKALGLAVAWDEDYRYELTYDLEGNYRQKGAAIAHGLTGTPVVRYVCQIDDEGRTTGLIEGVIPSQDRVNQSVFSTNITADFGAFKVRTAAGLQPTYRTDADGELVLDSNGHPIAEPIEISQAQLLISDSADTKFGQLDETPLQGYLLGEEQAMKNMAAIAQFPSHALMGSTVANISAEALQALEAQWWRFIELMKHQFGESNEEVFRLIAEALGDEEGAKAFESEARWRDMQLQAFPAMMDALGKAVQMVGLPRRAAWRMIPGATSGDLKDWETLYEDEQHDQAFGLTAGPAGAAARQKGLKDYQPPTPHFGPALENAQNLPRSQAGSVSVGG